MRFCDKVRQVCTKYDNWIWYDNQEKFHALMQKEGYFKEKATKIIRIINFLGQVV